MFSMLTLCIKHIHNILTKINKYYIYDDDQTLKKKFSPLFLELFSGYLSPMVSIPRYYILVSYRSQNYGIEPSLLLLGVGDMTKILYHGMTNFISR